MNTQLNTLLDGTSMVLTTDAPGSHYGLPVMRHEGCDQCGDLGPADTMPLCAYPQELIDLFGPKTAGEYAAQYAIRQTDPATEEAIGVFLSQLPTA